MIIRKKDNNMKKYLFTAVLFLMAAIIVAQVKIEAPMLKAPADNSTNRMPDAMLDWDAVISAMDYQLQVSEDTLFTAIILDTITGFTAVKSNRLKFDADYFWRVRTLYENEVASEWSTVWKFSTFEKIALQRPNDGVTDQPPDVLLRWNPRIGSVDISGVEFFNLQVDSTDAFDSPLLKEYTVNGAVFERTMTNLYFGVQYFWRARAGHAADISDWSDVRTFTTLSQIPLKNPADNATGRDLNVNLEWDNISGINRYEYQVDDNENFTSPMAELTTNAIEPAQGLFYGSQYYWRVRGRHDLDTTDWSAVRNFTTAAFPVLTNPADGDTAIVLRPQFRWNQIRGSVKYEINYCTDIELLCDNKFYRDAFDNEQPIFNVNIDLEPNTLYYWRVRAMSAIDTSDYSPVRTFTTVEPISVTEFFKEAELAIFPNPAQDMISVQVNASEDANVDLVLYDLLGQEVLKRTLNFSSGFNQEKIMLNNVANGIYLLKLTNGEQVYTNKIVVSK